MFQRRAFSALLATFMWSPYGIRITELAMNLVTSLCVTFLVTQWYQRDKTRGELFVQFVCISVTSWLTVLAFLIQTQRGKMKQPLMRRQRTIDLKMTEFHWSVWRALLLQCSLAPVFFRQRSHGSEDKGAGRLTPVCGLLFYILNSAGLTDAHTLQPNYCSQVRFIHTL